MPNGISPSNINSSAETKKNILKVLFVGELSERKGMDVLLNIIRKSDKHIEFTIAGDGYMKKDVQLVADKLSNVRYAGYLSESEVAKLYAESDALILPSRAESMPLTMLEAMSHGLTIIDSEECSLGLDKEIEHTCDNNKVTTYFYALSFLLKQKREGTLNKKYIKDFFQKNFSSHVVDPKVFKNIFEILL
jgi:glycosyltransferase involved in cell wall biosynthesis